MHIIDKIISSQLNIFASSFDGVAHSIFYDETKKSLLHPGEYGMLRESIVRDLLTNFLPESYGISDGFIVAPDGSVSGQCDIVIYSKEYCPIIYTAERQRFFPIESIVAVGEVKSTLDKPTLCEALAKLISIKTMRENLTSAAIAKRIFKDFGAYNAKEHHLDQVGTFIIANSFSCSKIEIINAIKNSTNANEARLRINLIVSINGSIITHRDNKGLCWMYPIDVNSEHKIINSPLQLLFSTRTHGSQDHLKLFLRYLEIIVTRTSVLHAEFTQYFQYCNQLVTESESDIKLA